MHRFHSACLIAAMTSGGFASFAMADAAAIRSNEVSDGTILIDFLDPSEDKREGWETALPYPVDVDPVVPLLSIGQMTIAHDSNNFYFRMEMDSTADPVADPVDGPFQSYLSSHHGIFIDIDQDPNTGYRGGDGDLGTDDRTMPIGADYYLEGPALFRFGNLTNPGGANPELYTWGTIIPWGSLNYDDGPVTDLEFEIPRSTLQNTLAFDFIAATTMIDYSAQDVYPSSTAEPEIAADGAYYTYSTTAVALPGDYDGSGTLDAADADLLISYFGDAAYDLTGDSMTNAADLAYWVEEIYGSFTGDANLDYSVDLLDLSALASAFGEPGSYAEGDFDGSGVVDLLDLSALASNFGSVVSLPEPTSVVLMVLGASAVMCRRCA